MTKRRMMWLGLLCLVVVLGGAAVAWRRMGAQRPAEAALVASGRLREAQIVLRDAMAKEPEAPALHARMGELQLRLGDPIAAEKEFRRAVALGAAPDAVLPGLARSLLFQKRYDEVIRLVPGGGATPVLMARNLLLRAEAQLAQGDARAAGRGLAQSRAGAPDAADTFLIAARVAAAADPGSAEVEPLADEVLRRDPANLDALLLKARLAARRGDAATARSMAGRTVEAAPWSSEARMARAYQEVGDGEDDKARADVALLLRNQPSLVDAVYLNALLLFRQGNLAEATTQLARLDAAGTRFPQVLFYQARIAQAQRQFETAAEMARRYAMLVPADPDGTRLLGETELALGRAADVLPAVRKAAQDRPDDPAMQVLYGRLLAATRNGAEASRVLLRVADGATPAALDAGVDAGLGAALLQAGQAARALPLLRSAAARRPGEAGPWEAVALAAIEVQDMGTAGMALERLRALPDTAAAAGNAAGLMKLRAGDADGAREEWAATVARVPGAMAARFNLARVLAAQGATAESLEQLRRILAQSPADVRALQLFIALSDGKPATLLPRLQAGHDAAPRNPLLTALLGDALIEAGRPQAAVELIQKAASSAGTPDLLLPVLGRAQAALGAVPEAIATYRAALAAMPEDGVTATALLRLVRERQGDAAGVMLLESLVEAAPGDQARMAALARLVWRTQGVDAALAVADRLAAAPAMQAAAVGLRGAVLMDAGRPAEAAMAFAADYRDHPALPTLLRLAAAQGSAGDTDAAAGTLRAWLADHPDATEAWGMLSKLEMRAGRTAEALASAGTVLKQRPGDAEALNNTAWMYFIARDPRAKAAARTAYLQAPSPDSADTLGWVLLSDGDVAGGLNLLRQANRQRPDDATIGFHLATALAADGQKAEATGMLTALLGGTSLPEEDRAAARATLDRLRAGP